MIDAENCGILKTCVATLEQINKSYRLSFTLLVHTHIYIYIYIYILIDKVKKKFNQNFKLESNFAPCVLSNF